MRPLSLDSSRSSAILSRCPHNVGVGVGVSVGTAVGVKVGVWVSVGTAVIVSATRAWIVASIFGVGVGVSVGSAAITIA